MYLLELILGKHNFLPNTVITISFFNRIRNLLRKEN